jgi:glucosamine 6-phosphate synthetase-like amidotransferase/phosphosugar isomerase protein
VDQKCLEHQGYDSVGVAIATDSKIYCQKATGKIVELESALAKHPITIAGTARSMRVEVKAE